MRDALAHATIRPRTAENRGVFAKVLPKLPTGNRKDNTMEILAVLFGFVIVAFIIGYATGKNRPDADLFPSIPPTRKRELMSMGHDKYINTSSEWKDRSELMKARFNHRCQVCNNQSGTKCYSGPGKKHLVSHHRTYANLGNEKPIDLTVLCNECHDLIHKHYDNTKGFGKP
jgi:hypothetical protein